MPKPPSIRAREVVRIAWSIGFVFDRQRGSHAVYYRTSDGRRAASSLLNAMQSLMGMVKNALNLHPFRSGPV